MKTEIDQHLSRGQFLKSLGLGSSGLMAFYCIGTLSACSSDEDDPGPDNGPGDGTGVTGTVTGNKINFTIDLNNSNFSRLKTKGSFVILGDVLVAFASNETYVAVQKLCTHQGNLLAYRNTENDIFCASHGSQFTTTGTVKEKPNTGENINDLKTFSTSLSSDKNSLTVKS